MWGQRERKKKRKKLIRKPLYTELIFWSWWERKGLKKCIYNGVFKWFFILLWSNHSPFSSWLVSVWSKINSKNYLLWFLLFPSLFLVFLWIFNFLVSYCRYLLYINSYKFAPNLTYFLCTWTKVCLFLNLILVHRILKETFVAIVYSCLQQSLSLFCYYCSNISNLSRR